jgi:hypothetical protein
MNKHFIFYLALWLFISMSSWGFAQYVPPEKRKKETPKDTVTQQPTNTDNHQTPTDENKPKKSKPASLKDRSFWQRLAFSPSIWASFGSNLIRIDASPTVGYKFTDKLNAGIGATYIYKKEEFPDYNYTLKSSFYGGRVYSQYYIIPEAFLWAETEALKVELLDQLNQKNVIEWQYAPQIGGGLQYGGLYLLVLYNLAYQDNRSWYGLPLVTRVGFSF